MSQKRPFNKQKLVLYFIVIGFIAYFFTRNSIDFSQLSRVRWTGRVGFAILLAGSMLLLRDLGYVLRLRLLTDKQLSFWTSVRIILLWEFGSAITPGMIGGKAVAIFLLIKNKVNAAKASSMVLLSILLDEFIFIVLFPLFYFFLGSAMLHGNTTCPDWIELRTKMPFIDNIKYLESTIFIILGFIMLFVVTAFIGIFLNPIWIRTGIYSISTLRPFVRWGESMRAFGDEILETSRQIKSKSFFFWVQLLFYTLMSWIGRYLVGVAVVWGFSTVNFSFIEVYTKQYALWLMFYLPSTPGSSGIAEALYMAFYCQYIEAGLSGAAAFIWRFISYYIYLAIGLAILFIHGERQNVVEEVD